MKEYRACTYAPMRMGAYVHVEIIK